MEIIQELLVCTRTEFGILHRIKEVVFDCQTSEIYVCQRDAVARVDVAECSLGIIRLHRDAFEHLVHVDLHEACDERLAFKRHIAYGNGDDDLLVLDVRVKYGYLRSGESLIVKAVIADIRLRAQGCIDKTVLVNESKLLEVIYLLHPRLVSLEVLHVRQIIIRHQVECDVQVLYLLVQVG